MYIIYYIRTLSVNRIFKGNINNNNNNNNLKFNEQIGINIIH